MVRAGQSLQGDPSPATSWTSFLGRTSQLARIEALLAAGERLVTLVGPGGIGKTRLALQAAEAQARQIEGRWWCDLSEVRTAEGLAIALGRALGISPGASLDAQASVEAVGHALAARGPALLVLDNAEQTLAPLAEALAAWRGRASQATFLLTSREALGVSGEQIVWLEPLGLPQQGASPEESEAVQLFVERTRAARPGYELNATDAPLVGAIVRRLDGLPLAIELAAARMGVLGPAEILARLSRPLALLRGGTRDAAARHQTLQAALDWSWRLLTQEEQAALARCSVFRGGFSLEAAEAVVAPEDSSPACCLGLLESLRNKSLVRTQEQDDAPGELRFVLLETIREYAWEQLQGELRSRTLARHASYYLDTIGPLAGSILLTYDAEALRRLRLEADNLQAIHERQMASDAPGAGERALRAALALGPLWLSRGPLSLLLAQVGAALARPGSIRLELQADAAMLTAPARSACGQHEQGLADAERALALARQAEDLRRQVQALLLLSYLNRIDRHRAAREHSLAALALLRQHGIHEAEPSAYLELGYACTHGCEFDEAQANAQAGFAAARRLNNPWQQAHAKRLMGVIAHLRGRLPEAASHYQGGLAVYQSLSNPREKAICAFNLGLTLQELGQFDEAERLIHDAISSMETTGDLRRSGFFKGFAGSLLHERGDLEAARRCYDEALGLLQAGLGDPRFWFFLAGRAAIDASQGRLQDAAAALDQAEAALERANRSLLARAARMFRGHLYLALARRLASDDETALAYWARAAALVTDPEVQRGLQQRDEIRLACRLLRQALGPSLGPPLIVGPEACWLRVPRGPRVELGRRPQLARLVLALTRQRLRAPGEPLQEDAITPLVWPDDRALPTALTNRLHVAIAHLRRVGLRSLLLRDERGYQLDPSVPLLFAELRPTRETRQERSRPAGLGASSHS